MHAEAIALSNACQIDEQMGVGPLVGTGPPVPARKGL
jgi:hypothetical protein